MSIPIKDGGAAFPFSYIDNTKLPIRETVVAEGMSLRDYFAGQALQSLVGRAAFDQSAEDMMIKGGVNMKECDQFIAFIAYGFADAMISQRTKEATP